MALARSGWCECTALLLLMWSLGSSLMVGRAVLGGVAKTALAAGNGRWSSGCLGTAGLDFLMPTFSNTSSRFMDGLAGPDVDTKSRELFDMLREKLSPASTDLWHDINQIEQRARKRR